MKGSIDKIREQFPILLREVNKRPLVYFDNAATTQKPLKVIEGLNAYYMMQNSNIHRGVHTLSQEATNAYEEVREKVRAFINADSTKEIIFTRGTTESVNLIANSFAKAFLSEGDEILISEMEHHSNIVPWQMVCEEKGAKVRTIPVNPQGELVLDDIDILINNNTKLVAIGHVSNALGTINPVKEIIELAHKKDVPVLIDGAQAIAHLKVDVKELDADFYCFSGHKMYAPMGIGILYGKEEWLDKLPPYQGGGEMIDKVSFKGTTYNELPFKFEAGTPNVGDALGLGLAIDFMLECGYDEMIAYEDELLEYATEQLKSIPGLKIIGEAKNKTAVVSFLLDKIHPYDAGIILDKLGIAVRTGHHCAQPLMEAFNIPGTIRASIAVYNTKEEIDKLKAGIEQVITMFA